MLATADETSMALAEDAGVTGEVATFATNVLTIVTPTGNPAGIESLDDLEGVTWVRCADEVPCGKVAVDRARRGNGVTAEPVSLEDDVRATLDKVISGEADAGLVYATDAVAAGDDVDDGGDPRAPSAAADVLLRGRRWSSPTTPTSPQDWVDVRDVRRGRRRSSRRPGSAAP